MTQAQRNIKTAFWMGTIAGLVGLFGLGHLYLGRRQRGIIFLALTAVLYVDVLAGLFISQLWQTPVSPAVVFGVGWILQTYDLYALTKKPVQNQ